MSFMNYRPITDFWILARGKVSYYGAFPAGFLERARQLLVSGRNDLSILHVCSGMVHKYNGAGGFPLKGFSKKDLRLDINPLCKPDIICDVRNIHGLRITKEFRDLCYYRTGRYSPDAALIDRPYSENDSREYEKRYKMRADSFPAKLNNLVADTLEVITPGGVCGVLDYEWPSLDDKLYKCVFAVAVATGKRQRIRIFTGWVKR